MEKREMTTAREFLKASLQERFGENWHVMFSLAIDPMASWPRMTEKALDDFRAIMSEYNKRDAQEEDGDLDELETAACSGGAVESDEERAEALKKFHAEQARERDARGPSRETAYFLGKKEDVRW